MGILKKLTDEYFEKELRTEDGKFMEVMGCKVLVPVDFTEDDFFILLNEAITDYDGETIFSYKRYLNDYNDNEYEKIKCGDDNYIVYPKLKNADINFNVTESQYDSVKKFLEYIFEVADITTHNGDEMILLVDESTQYHKFHYKFYEAEIDDNNGYIEDDCWDLLVDDFLTAFEEKVDIGRGDIEYFSYNNMGSNVCIKLQSQRNNYLYFNVLKYSREMTEWWKKVLDKIDEMGVKEYFGLEDEEE